jgi:hypothetical protein
MVLNRLAKINHVFIVRLQEHVKLRVVDVVKHKDNKKSKLSAYAYCILSNVSNQLLLLIIILSASALCVVA